MNLVLKTVIYLIATYFIAGIPSAFIVTRIILKKDIRDIGSGNVGATNVYRAGGLKLAIPVFLFDFLKGMIPTLLSIFILGRNVEISILVAIVAIIGHILTPYLKFKGGKGAATSFGAFVTIFPLPVAGAVIVFALSVVFSRMVALGTILSAIALPILYFILGYILGLSIPFEFSFYVLGLMIVICLFIIYKHKSNIERMIKGRENKV